MKIYYNAQLSEPVQVVFHWLSNSPIERNLKLSKAKSLRTFAKSVIQYLHLMCS